MWYSWSIVPSVLGDGMDKMAAECGLDSQTGLFASVLMMLSANMKLKYALTHFGQI